MGQVWTATQSQGSRFGHCMKTLPFRSALPSVTPPPAALLHTTGTALLIPVIDDTLRRELDKLAHIVFSFQKYKEDTDYGILFVTELLFLAYQRTSKAVAISACQGSPGPSQGGVSSEGFGWT